MWLICHTRFVAHLCSARHCKNTHSKVTYRTKAPGAGRPQISSYSQGKHSLVRKGEGCALAPPMATTIGPEPELRPLAPVRSSVPQDQDERMLELIWEKLKERFCMSSQESVQWA